MGIQYLIEFEKIAEACGSRYAAVRWVTRKTRELENSNRNYNIPESKIITWALTGMCPYSEENLRRRKIPNKLDHVEELLEYVLDDEVKQEVFTFYRLSVRGKRLILCDRDDLGESRLSRVNILLRMAWNNFI